MPYALEVLTVIKTSYSRSTILRLQENRWNAKSRMSSDEQHAAKKWRADDLLRAAVFFLACPWQCSWHLYFWYLDWERFKLLGIFLWLQSLTILLAGHPEFFWSCCWLKAGFFIFKLLDRRLMRKSSFTGHSASSVRVFSCWLRSNARSYHRYLEAHKCSCADPSPHPRHRERLLAASNSKEGIKCKTALKVRSSPRGSLWGTDLPNLHPFDVPPQFDRWLAMPVHC